MQFMREAGLELRRDAVGNIIGRLAGAEAEAPIIATGSHIDTVPNAGKLDGVLGKDTTAALRAAHTDADRWFALLAAPEFHLK